MRTKLLTRLLGPAVIAASLVAIGLPASASATSWNDRSQFMHIPGRQSDSLCTWRYLTLGPGNYRWRVFAEHSLHNSHPRVKTRVLHLRHARYQWVDCMPVSGRGYGHYSRLYNESHGGEAELKGGYILGNYGSGIYRWGSTLNRVH
jgi:hypothetical protein